MKTYHPDQQPYIHMARRQRVDTAVNTLEGILKGIAIDRHINTAEAKELTAWSDDFRDLLTKHPFTEIVPQINEALKNGRFEPHQQAEIVWVCQNLSSASTFYDEITSDIQVLQGILHGVMADEDVTLEEATRLSDWVESNAHLKGCYPYDELDSLLVSVLKDKRVTKEESDVLKAFFADFINYSLSKRIQKAREAAQMSVKSRLTGICAMCPTIEFQERVFCFTGGSARAVRRELTELVIARGGTVRDDISADLNYLVVGAAGNPCWAFSCYGRKIEQVMTLRRNGHKATIVHENDFWDAVQDEPA